MIIVKAACVSDTGLKRTVNEDNFFFCGFLNSEKEDRIKFNTLRILPQMQAVFGVFDGLGGLRDGADAALCVADSFEEVYASCSNVEDISERLRLTCIELSNRVTNLSSMRKYKLGCTAVILSLSGDKACLANVGDSKAYIIRSGELKTLSKEHTDRKLIEAIGARRTPTLTQYLGYSENNIGINPYTCSLGLQRGDRFILCSDGLSSLLGENEILQISISHPQAEDCAQLLLDNAVKAGGSDNITVIICDIG